MSAFCRAVAPAMVKMIPNPMSRPLWLWPNQFATSAWDQCGWGGGWARVTGKTR